eukprot:3002319-Pleurochrysis_carterae.AAC.1
MAFYPQHSRPYVSHAANSLPNFVVDVNNVHPGAIECMCQWWFSGDFVKGGAAITVLHPPRLL